jgi:hypothetical protein
MEPHPIEYGVAPLRDDWPFVYLRSHKIPSEYLIAMLMIAVASAGAVRLVSGRRWQGIDAHYFALGAGFLLLETRGLGVLAVLVGSTWYVTSAIFSGVLVMALGSTIVAAKIARTDPTGTRALRAYVFLGAALALMFVVPPEDLASFPLVARAALGASLVSSPLFASGVIFSAGLARMGSADRALASNLLGALVGGLSEYVAMITGFRLLILVSACFYLASLLLDLRARRAA